MQSRKFNLFSKQLGPADTAALAAGVGQLTRTGLPLPAGLRALADELPGRRLRLELRTMAARLEKGDSLEAVLNSSSSKLPPHFHGLLLAGLKAGRLPEVMDEYVRVEQERRGVARAAPEVHHVPYPPRPLPDAAGQPRDAALGEVPLRLAGDRQAALERVPVVVGELVEALGPRRWSPRMLTKKLERQVWKPRAARVTPGTTSRMVWA